ncbi:MAG: ATPase domain-containing protein [Candidatus Micrarchaeia archaeon]
MEGKIKSGIPGLDAMMGGGFAKGSTVAVAGGTGSGRTIFISQFLYKGAIEHNEPGLFISFDDQKDSLYPNLASFGWDMLDLERKQKIVFIEYPHNELAAFADQESAMKDLIATLGIKRVVIDSITPFSLMFSSSEERRLAVLKLVSAVKGWKCTTLISSEILHGSEEQFPHTVSGVESFCDGFIHLSFRRDGGKRVREVEIVKMRGSKHEHEFRVAQITEDGFVVGSGAKPSKKKVVADE